MRLALDNSYHLSSCCSCSNGSCCWW